MFRLLRYRGEYTARVKARLVELYGIDTEHSSISLFPDQSSYVTLIHEAWAAKLDADHAAFRVALSYWMALKQGGADAAQTAALEQKLPIMLSMQQLTGSIDAASAVQYIELMAKAAVGTKNARS